MSKISSTFLQFFFQKRFLNTISSSKLPLAPSSTIEFLKNSCGLDSESLSFGKRMLKIDEKSCQKFESVLGFLKSHGFENSQIDNLVAKQPLILLSKIDSNLKPKFEFLHEIGLVGPLLPKVILSNPVILSRGLDSHLKPSFYFLRKMLESDEKVTNAILRSSWLLTYSFTSIQSNIDILIREGVTSRSIGKLFVWQPRNLTLSVNRTIHIVKIVKELGIEPTAPMFIHAYRVRIFLNDSTWKKKLNVFKSLGWSENQILAAFKKDPYCFAISEEKMRQVVDFCFNTAKLDPETVITCPKLLCHGLDSRLRPRYKVIEVLMRKNLIKNRSICRLFIEDEGRFLKYSVLKHLSEIPDLMDLYCGITAGKTQSVLYDQSCQLNLDVGAMQHISA